MAKITLKNAKISGVSIVLGEDKLKFADETHYYNNDPLQLLKMQKSVGFKERYWAKSDTTTLDLCQQAAEKLLKEMGISTNSIDAIVFVTQTPDYYMPGNAHVIHRNMGFGNETFAIDLEFGCSGYIYGLYTAFMMIQTGLKRVLLLAGDTLSKVANKKDRTEAPLFGDSGSATIVEYDKTANETYFVLRSDGKGIEHMLQPAGAYRIPGSKDTKKEIINKDGSIRSLENIYMNGFEIFTFTLTRQPALLNEILEFSGNTKDDISYFVFHQANVYIVETIMKKSKIPLDKCPSKIFEKYGNQNSASIPSVICSELSGCFNNNPKKVLLQGFGIGLSWGACITEMKNVICLKPSIYNGGRK